MSGRFLVRRHVRDMDGPVHLSWPCEGWRRGLTEEEEGGLRNIWCHFGRSWTEPGRSGLGNRTNGSSHVQEKITLERFSMGLESVLSIYPDRLLPT